MGHVRMMGAIQPFLSGAISKTVNMPEAATAEEIETVYLEGWKLGLKAIAIYRDGSQALSQPLSTGKKKDDGAARPRRPRPIEQPAPRSSRPPRWRPPSRIAAACPNERDAVTHKFEIAGHEGYITVGLYPDGQPGEIFLKMAKEGSTVSGLMDTLATSVSLALQYGVPLRDLVNKFAHVRFEPAGFTGNSEIPIAKSHRRLRLPLDGLAVPADGRQGVARADRPVGDRGRGAVGVRWRARRRASGAVAITPPAAVSPAPVVEPDRPNRSRAGSPSRRRAIATSVSAPAPTSVAKEELTVIATNGNGHARHERERQDARAVRRQPRRVARWRHEGRVRDPGRRPVLRRLRLDHGPQRQLLQVPQLREHQRLQLSPSHYRSPEPRLGASSCAVQSSGSDSSPILFVGRAEGRRFGCRLTAGPLAAGNLGADTAQLRSCWTVLL